MRKILIIGIGAGNPDFVTIQAINALNTVDVFFIPNKGEEKAALRKLRTDLCERFIKDRTYRVVDVGTPKRDQASPDYRAGVDDWHARIGEQYERLLREELGDDQCGAFLVWGDPALYDSTLRIVEKIRSNGLVFEYEVIPGISSVQVLAARHRIPLNRIGEPVLLTTGRKLAEGLPENADSVVVLLDGDQTFRRFKDQDLDIFWGAYLGTEDEVLVSGKLADVSDEIDATRKRLRKQHGWIMDTYLLRKPPAEADDS